MQSTNAIQEPMREVIQTAVFSGDNILNERERKTESPTRKREHVLVEVLVAGFDVFPRLVTVNVIQFFRSRPLAHKSVLLAIRSRVLCRKTSTIPMANQKRKMLGCSDGRKLQTNHWSDGGNHGKPAHANC